MMILDVNVLVYAYRQDSEEHVKYRQWLEIVLNGVEVFGVTHDVLSSVIRVVTHPRIFKKPSSFEEAHAFIRQVKDNDKCALIMPGARHWDIFVSLCRQIKAEGNAIPDAYLAALVIETGNELITTDKGFGRFPNLKWKHPLKDS